MNMAFQGFSIGSNVWLSVWSDANATDADGNQDTAARDMYLGVYGALGIGQGKLHLIHSNLFYDENLYFLNIVHQLVIYIFSTFISFGPPFRSLLFLNRYAYLIIILR